MTTLRYALWPWTCAGLLWRHAEARIVLNLLNPERRHGRSSHSHGNVTSQLEREYQLKKLETHLTDVSSDVDEWVALLRHSLKAMEQHSIMHFGHRQDLPLAASHRRH